MQYMLMFFEPVDVMAQRNDPEKVGAYMGAWMAYVQAINAAGIVVSASGHQLPDTATTVRVRADHRHVQDGPFADTKEQLGGYYVIDVPDLDTALTWAARAPCAATAGVEVRPCMPPMPQG